MYEWVDSQFVKVAGGSVQTVSELNLLQSVIVLQTAASHSGECLALVETLLSSIGGSQA